MISNKRAPLPYRTDRTKNFEKSWQRYNKNGRYNMQDAVIAMNLITNRQPIPAEYCDHALTGELSGYRELHIGGDFLLIYRVDDKKEIVYFTDIGTHAELFK
ncbi:Addiction module toxin, RelE/StbE family [Xenorhabdus bovienii str. oregonense]|uniref:Addiction module toxin, RelE/StbE family n=1 Tax=Xenorhabdus bovienii str. oregonense TaxID=1398202 RepID=A0A077PD16_XENBV|nr:type II toxin-antitoxin system YafQ family toxin [Xenorhabdus bovienii]CDH07601.1 Addiction module toxin, RelE/StbE family [Xenorhabdus bovienii str. oregonense]